jgi:hypothetical protein
LPFLADLRKEEVAAVALDLLATERAVLHDAEARLGPALEAALEVDHVRVAEVVERLGREHGAQARLAIQHDRGGRLGCGRADAELEEAAADIRGAFDRAVAILVRVADVDDDDGFTRVEPLLQLGRRLLGNDLAGFAQHLLQRLHVRAPCGGCPFRISEFILPPFPVGARKNAPSPEPK